MPFSPKEIPHARHPPGVDRASDDGGRRNQPSFRAIRSSPGLQVGRRSDGGRRHGGGRRRQPRSRPPGAGIHGHRRRAAETCGERGVHLRQRPTRPSARCAARSLRLEQHRSAAGTPDHDCHRSQQHRYAHGPRRDGGAQAVRLHAGARRSAVARDLPAPGADCRLHHQPRSGSRLVGAHHRHGRAGARAVQHQQLRGCDVRKPLGSDHHAAVAVPRVRRHRPQHDVELRS